MMKALTFLWIDDMQNWASSAQTNLKLISPKYSIDLHIMNAINGEEILQQCMMFNFDAVIMDYHMEPHNGDKYIRDVRNEEHLEAIPIIFYSQDNSSNLDLLISDLKNVITVYRPNLEDKIKLESPVEAILVEDGKVKAVRAKGVTHEVSAVVSTAPAPVLSKLVEGTDALESFS